MRRQGARPALSANALIHKDFAISFRHHINNFHIQYVSLKAHWSSWRLSRASNRGTVSRILLPLLMCPWARRTASWMPLCDEPPVFASLKKKGWNSSQKPNKPAYWSKKTSRNHQGTCILFRTLEDFNQWQKLEIMLQFCLDHCLIFKCPFNIL